MASESEGELTYETMSQLDVDNFQSHASNDNTALNDEFIMRFGIEQMVSNHLIEVEYQPSIDVVDVIQDNLVEDANTMSASAEGNIFIDNSLLAVDSNLSSGVESSLLVVLNDSSLPIPIISTSNPISTSVNTNVGGSGNISTSAKTSVTTGSNSGRGRQPIVNPIVGAKASTDGALGNNSNSKVRVRRVNNSSRSSSKDRSTSSGRGKGASFNHVQTELINSLKESNNFLKEKLTIAAKSITDLTAQCIENKKQTAALQQLVSSLSKGGNSGVIPPPPAKLPILASFYKDIEKMVVNPAGLPKLIFKIQPNGGFRNKVEDPIQPFAITYTTFVRLRRYENFTEVPRKSSGNQFIATAATNLDKLQLDYRVQYKQWLKGNKQTAEPVFHVIIPMIVSVGNRTALINLPIVVVANGLVDLISNDDMDEWYIGTVQNRVEHQDIHMDMSGHSSFFALLVYHAHKESGVFSGTIKQGTYEHRVVIPEGIVHPMDSRPSTNSIDSFWILPESIPPSGIMPTNINSKMVCRFGVSLTHLPINSATVAEYYATYDSFLKYKNNYYVSAGSNKRPVTNLTDSSANQQNKYHKPYSILNSTEVNPSGSYLLYNDKLDNYDSNNSDYVMNYYQNSQNENNFELPHQYIQNTGFKSNIINNDSRFQSPAAQNIEDEIESLSNRLKVLSSSVVKKHSSPVIEPLTVNERTAHPIKMADFSSPKPTSEYYYNGTTNAQTWEVVTASIDNKYSFDLKGYQAVIAGVTVDFSETLQEALDIGIPCVGPLAPARSGLTRIHNKNDSYGNGYDNSSYHYPDISATSKSSKSTIKTFFDPTNLGEAKELIIKAVIKINPTWVKGQSLNHIDGRHALEYLMNQCFDSSNPVSKEAHTFITDLRIVATNPLAWNITVAAIMAKYFSLIAKTTAQAKFTGYFQRMDEPFEDYIRKMLTLAEGPFGTPDRLVYVAQTIAANAVTCPWLRTLITRWSKLKKDHWSSYPQMCLEMTQTIVPEGIKEYGLVLPEKDYPDYPEKNQDYSRHTRLVAKKQPPQTPPAANNKGKAKGNLYKDPCGVCGMNNHRTAEHNNGGTKPPYSKDAKGADKTPIGYKAACYTCGSEEHLRPDCPQYKQILEAAAKSAKTNSKGDDKSPPDNSAAKGGKQKQLLLKPAPDRP